MNNNTALGANIHMVFINEEHERFYTKYLKEVRRQDVYHKSLIYILGISSDTRNNFKKIYDIKTGCIKTDCLHEGWQTSGSRKVVRLAFNLYTDGKPSTYDYETEEDRIGECGDYSVGEIFCCGYAPYFWEGIKIRYPEYVTAQRSILDVLMDKGEKC